MTAVPPSDAPSAPVPPRVHPRIRERLVEVQRTEGRRRLRILMGAGGVAAVTLLGWGATRSALLDIDHVELRGARQTPADDIVTAGRLGSDRPLLDVDAAGSARAIERLPWVASAHVERRFPGTVRVVVVERRPVAAVAARTGGWAVVDRSGRILAIRPDLSDGLPAVGGVRPAGRPGGVVAPEVLPALRVAAVLPADVVRRVSDIAGPADAIELRLRPLLPRATGGPLVRFGPAVQVPDKGLALLTLLAKADLRRVEVIDVRVPGAPVLTRG